MYFRNMLLIDEKKFVLKLDLCRFRDIMSICFMFDSEVLDKDEKEWFEQFRSGTYAKCVSPNFSQVSLQVCE